MRRGAPRHGTRRRRLRIAPIARRIGARRRSSRGEQGFTLIEMLIVIIVMPIVISAVCAGLVEIFRVQNSVSNRLSDSGDAQVVSANFVQDVQSAQQITTDPAAAQCGPGKQLLGLEWNLNPSNLTYQTVVTYAAVQNGSTWLLRRQYCSSGTSPTPVGATTISYGISPSQAPPSLSPSTSNTLATQGWVPVSTLTGTTFAVHEPASNYTFTLTAVPAASGPPSGAGSPIVIATNTQCGFAPTQGGTVQNGTYAKKLCLVDFSPYSATAAAAPQCQEMVASIPGGDTLSFCLSTSGNVPLVAAGLPTYPEAFLGNTIGGQPFYTGMGCPDSTPAVDGLGNPTPSCIKPALYQTCTGCGGEKNTIVVTNITVTTPTGAPATGWQFVSADAETTDVTESITWISDKSLNILPNTPTSPYGDTCNNMPNWNGPQGYGSTQVVCQSGNQETAATKTGTPMVEALQPSTMTVYMYGAGLEGISLGLLLS